MKLYAFALPTVSEKQNWLKIGQTTGSVEERVRAEISQVNLTYQIVWQDTGLIGKREITDRELRHELESRGFEIGKHESGRDAEWVRCRTEDVADALETIKDRYAKEDKREQLSQEFYERIRNWYYWATEESNDGEYSLRIIIRLLLCFFLREKELVPAELFDKRFIDEHLKEDEFRYYKAVLRNLFFHSLNTPVRQRGELENRKLIEHYNKIKDVFHKRIPFLNGGLFTEHSGDDFALNDDYFFSEKRGKILAALADENTRFQVEGIVRILSSYQYTLDETDSTEHIDPEFIGRIFECLLVCIDADTRENRQRVTGSYYTPRNIVNYMVNESLNAYLETVSNADDENALLRCSILDPACGSGAFPCGIMNVIMQRLDPQKTLTQAERYQKKLEILRNVIYGVDIQPMAVQISMFRLFLSLVLELQPAKNANDNFGIEALPNLDYKFCCADTLRSIHIDGLFFHAHRPLFNQIIKLKEDYFRETLVTPKERLRERIANAEKELAEQSDDEQIQALQKWNHSDTEPSPYFDSRWMFGVEKFDIVIGNPPYLKAEYFHQKQKTLYSNEFGFTADLYIYFIFKCFEMTAEGGTLCLITNDGYLGFRSTEKVRKLFLENDLRQIVKNDRVFENADIYTAVFLLKKQPGRRRQYKTAYDYGGKFTDAGAVDYELSQNLVHHRLVMNSGMVKLFQKFIPFRKLKEICSVLDTGIHSGNCRSKLFFREKEKTNLQRLLQGKQINRYALSWDTPGAKFKYCDVCYVPQAEFGVGRGGKKSRTKEYWHFCGEEKNHRADEKILLRQSDDDLIACYVNREKDGLFYTDNTLFTVLPKSGYHIFFVLGLLNSRLLNSLYHFLSQEEGKAMAQVKTQVVEFLPCPPVDGQQQPPLIKLVGKRLQGDEKAEAGIDELVYQLYGLTDEEIKIAEGR